MRPRVLIYTDGSCYPNPGGDGGYGAVIIWGDWRMEIHGHEPETTNNRMEILAAIEALEILPEPCVVVLYSDSKHVINTMSKGWNTNHNHDLWERLKAQAKRHSVTWYWLRGHAGHEMNERADVLAGAARKGKLERKAQTFRVVREA